MSANQDLMSQKEQDSTRILVAEAVSMLEEKTALLIDIREQEELEAEGKAKGALWFPLSKLLVDEATLDASLATLDLTKTLIFYCKSGGRVSRLLAILPQKNIVARNMGGLKDWIAAGQKVESFK